MKREAKEGERDMSPHTIDLLGGLGVWASIIIGLMLFL
jgi:hypothetical protein